MFEKHSWLFNDSDGCYKGISKTLKVSSKHLEGKKHPAPCKINNSKWIFSLVTQM